MATDQVLWNQIRKRFDKIELWDQSQILCGQSVYHCKPSFSKVSHSRKVTKFENIFMFCKGQQWYQREVESSRGLKSKKFRIPVCKSDMGLTWWARQHFSSSIACTMCPVPNADQESFLSEQTKYLQKVSVLWNWAAAMSSISYQA